MYALILCENFGDINLYIDIIIVSTATNKKTKHIEKILSMQSTANLRLAISNAKKLI
jgi:hypothetical protein